MRKIIAAALLLCSAWAFAVPSDTPGATDILQADTTLPCTSDAKPLSLIDSSKKVASTIKMSAQSERAIIEWLQSHSTGRITKDWSKGSDPFCQNIKPALTLIHGGAYVGARDLLTALRVQNPKIETHPLFLPAMRFLDAIYAPIADAHNAEELDLMQALTAARKQVSAAQKVLGGTWARPGVATYFRSLSYNEPLSRKVAIGTMCGTLTAEEWGRIIAIGRHAVAK